MFGRSWIRHDISEAENSLSLIKNKKRIDLTCLNQKLESTCHSISPR